MGALEVLDGYQRPLLVAAEATPAPESGHPSSGMAMIIASGLDGYTCEIHTPDDEKVFVMLSRDQRAAGYRSIIRPYPDQIPAAEVVDKNDVIIALEQFTSDGTKAGGYKW